MNRDAMKGQDEELLPDDAAVRRESRRHTRRSFLFAAAAAAAGYGFYDWIGASSRNEMQPALLRKAFQTNANLSEEIFRNRGLAPTYPVKEAKDLRVNGVYGLRDALVPASWRLQMVGVAGAEKLRQFVPDVTAWEYEYTIAPDPKMHIAPSADTAEKMSPVEMMASEKTREERANVLPRGKEEAGRSDSTLQNNTPGLLLAMDAITSLPRHEMVTQFKCIEGWSQIVQWAGYRMADLMEAFPPALKPDGTLPRYVYMETPNGDYYVGYDLEACRHPQTLLVTEMSGQPLGQFHGAPIRLHAPTKYGYKQIKRIGLIAYTDIRPDDYWTRLGYDWYGGL